ncbi:MAG TPA: ATP-binding protein [Chlamydiales bacterium]|nr:ATP-binding protein [Chlamydiales bacterium]
MVIKKTFSAKLDQLHSMLHWIQNQLVPMQYDQAILSKIELASEEALVNIIHHAYKDRSGKIEIEVNSFPGKRVEISIRDQGPPFNPLEYSSKIDLNASLEDREEGGLGIFFLLKCMDEVRYEREKGSNVLILIHSSQTK